ncbi:helix-turn-helix domain-containing protein [Actinomadura latina]|uniref:PucR family transcriptional regulator n=1 Tax=Actinomadura latina TaxID=163603 RepID=A0A846Z795_9ACTN|nr:helix-turn-helix domain-containing protein [Actinomadura latina]NKZ07677.1 PucR family transcriptional regulator [Actinomadura latina]
MRTPERDGGGASAIACAGANSNTLRYRIRRIAGLTGRDIGTLGDRVGFFLARRAASTLW